MTDEFYNPSLLLGDDGLKNYWSRSWYSSLYNSGYVYYPALDVTTGTGTATNNRLGRQGREWFQHPDAWTRVRAHEPLPGPPRHEVGRRDPRLLRRSGALRADQSGLQLGADGQQLRHARTSSTPAISGRRSCSAALDNQTSARLVPLQNPDLRGYAAYFQDDFDVERSADAEPRPALGVRARPDRSADNRLSQRIDLTQADSRDAGDAARHSGRRRAS